MMKQLEINPIWLIATDLKDENSPSIIYRNRDLETDAANRDWVIIRMNEVTRLGKKTRISDNISLFQLKPKEFVIDLVGEDRDVAGRRSPVMLYGRFPIDENQCIADVLAILPEIRPGLQMISKEDMKLTFECLKEKFGMPGRPVTICVAIAAIGTFIFYTLLKKNR